MKISGQDAPDFHAVPERQEAMHARLLNWAAWCRSSPGSTASPMFRQYRSTDVWAPVQAARAVDGVDARRIAAGIARIGHSERHALQWHYVRPIAPYKMARALSLTPEGLAQTVINARDSLANACATENRAV